MSNHGFQIAIDGPVAAGKSTVARLLAERLQFVYVDTGAMYRAVTLLALRQGVEVTDETRLADLVKQAEIDVRIPQGEEVDGRTSTVLLNSEDVSHEIREKPVSKAVAVVAALPKVREALVPKQQEIAEGKEVVMEGRDISSVVLPHADLKIFMEAEEQVRAERYRAKMSASGKEVTFEEALAMLRERDELDRTRAASPLRKVEDAWVVDTTELSIDEVVEKIAARVNAMR